MSEQTSSFNKKASNENSQYDTGDLNYGYDFYPERRSGELEKGLWSSLTEGRSAGRKLRCYSNVHWCIKNSEYMLFFVILK